MINTSPILSIFRAKVFKTREMLIMLIMLIFFIFQKCLKQGNVNHVNLLGPMGEGGAPKETKD